MNMFDLYSKQMKLYWWYKLQRIYSSIIIYSVPHASYDTKVKGKSCFFWQRAKTRRKIMNVVFENFEHKRVFYIIFQAFLLFHIFKRRKVITDEHKTDIFILCLRFIRHLLLFHDLLHSERSRKKTKRKKQLVNARNMGICS